MVQKANFRSFHWIKLSAARRLSTEFSAVIGHSFTHFDPASRASAIFSSPSSHHCLTSPNFIENADFPGTPWIRLQEFGAYMHLYISRDGALRPSSRGGKAPSERVSVLLRRSRAGRKKKKTDGCWRSIKSFY